MRDWLIIAGTLLMTAALGASPFVVNPYAFGGGASSPASEGEQDRWTEIAAGATTTGIRPATAIPAGSRAVLVVQWISGTQTIGSISDDSGNTWALDETISSGNENLSIYSAPVTTEIGTGDDVEVNWTNPANTFRWGALYELSGVSGVDVTAEASAGSGTDASVTGTTTSAATVIFGVLKFNSQATTANSFTWTVEAAHDISSVRRSYYYHGTESTAGLKDSGGTISASQAWQGIWVAYD